MSKLYLIWEGRSLIGVFDEEGKNKYLDDCEKCGSIMPDVDGVEVNKRLYED